MPSETDYYRSQLLSLVKHSAKDGLPQSQGFAIPHDETPFFLSGDQLDGACLVNMRLARGSLAKPAEGEELLPSPEAPKVCNSFEVITPPDIGPTLTFRDSITSADYPGRLRELNCLTSHVSGREFRRISESAWTRTVQLATMEQTLTDETLRLRFETNLENQEVRGKWHALVNAKAAGGTLSIEPLSMADCDGYRFLEIAVEVALP